MENQIRIYSTKKLLPNQRQYLLNAGFSVTEADFINVSAKPFEYKTTNDYLIFTSQNAVESVIKNKKLAELKGLKAFCVGEKTKSLLEQNGFDVIVSSDYAAELASIICNQYAKNSFTFFSGNLRRDILPDAMQLARIKYDEIEVYETLLTPRKNTAQSEGVLFFSPSAVESYLKKNKLTHETCFCIGKATAEIAEHFTENIVIANQPTIENVIVQTINYYSHKP